MKYKYLTIGLIFLMLIGLTLTLKVNAADPIVCKDSKQCLETQSCIKEICTDNVVKCSKDLDCGKEYVCVKEACVSSKVDSTTLDTKYTTVTVKTPEIISKESIIKTNFNTAYKTNLTSDKVDIKKQYVEKGITFTQVKINNVIYTVVSAK